MTRVADLVARELARAGTGLAFGMPGGEVVTMLDALREAGIRFVLARNESAAAMMAAGAHWMTGKPGLLLTTLGPGLANAVNGIADAWQERVPLIVLSGVVERRLRGRYTHQIVDHSALLAPLVKGSFEIGAEGTQAVVRRAIRLALTPPCGPVHLDLAPDVAAAAAAEAPAAGKVDPNPAAAAPAGAALDRVRERLALAERPLVIAGLDAVRGGAADALREGMGQGIPVVTTYKAKGLVDETEAFSLGAAGLSPLADRILLPLARSADLVLLVGYDPIEMRPNWLDFAEPSRIVELAGTPPDHGMHAAADIVVGPLGPLAQAVLGVPPRQRRWPGGEPADARASLAEAFAPRGGFGAHEVVATLADMLPDAALLTTDSGAHRILLSQQWRCRRPLSLLQSAGWCTMGGAVPLAVGAGLAGRGRPVVAVLGDGGLEMTLGELGTLRDERLPAVVVVLQDESLGLIALKQAQAGLPSAGVTLGATDYAMCARAFGGHGTSVSDASSLARALQDALARDVFSVIACRIGPHAYDDAI